MKKLIAFGVMAALLSSCSEDEGANNENEFFPIDEGNLWVYRQYSVSAEGVEITSGQTDSVRVVGYQTTEGQTYSDFRHRIYSGQGAFIEERHELLRVDENGHLVTDYNKVIHPGTDTGYQYISEILQPVGGGYVTWQLEQNVDVTVEGNNYNVFPYTGYFTPSAMVNYPAGMACKTSYQPGVGIVVEHRRLTFSLGYIEDRLIYYELN